MKEKKKRRTGTKTAKKTLKKVELRRTPEERQGKNRPHKNQTTREKRRARVCGTKTAQTKQRCSPGWELEAKGKD